MTDVDGHLYDEEDHLRTAPTGIDASSGHATARNRHSPADSFETSHGGATSRPADERYRARDYYFSDDSDPDAPLRALYSGAVSHSTMDRRDARLASRPSRANHGEQQQQHDRELHRSHSRRSAAAGGRENRGMPSSVEESGHASHSHPRHRGDSLHSAAEGGHGREDHHLAEEAGSGSAASTRRDRATAVAAPHAATQEARDDQGRGRRRDDSSVEQRNADYDAGARHRKDAGSSSSRPHHRVREESEGEEGEEHARPLPSSSQARDVKRLQTPGSWAEKQARVGELHRSMQARLAELGFA